MTTLRARSSIKGVGRTRGFVRDFCRASRIDEETASIICTALDELLPNIVAICSSPRIEFTMAKDAGRLVFSLTHSGPRYDLSDSGAIVWPRDKAGFEFSELSLHVIHSSLDKVECLHANGENKMNLIKILPA